MFVQVQLCISWGMNMGHKYNLWICRSTYSPLQWERWFRFGPPFNGGRSQLIHFLIFAIAFQVIDRKKSRFRTPKMRTTGFYHDTDPSRTALTHSFSSWNPNDQFAGTDTARFRGTALPRSALTKRLWGNAPDRLICSQTNCVPLSQHTGIIIPCARSWFNIDKYNLKLWY